MPNPLITLAPQDGLSSETLSVFWLSQLIDYIEKEQRDE